MFQRCRHSFQLRSFPTTTTTTRCLRTRGRKRPPSASKRLPTKPGAEREMQLALRRINELMATTSEESLLQAACPQLAQFLETTSAQTRIGPSTIPDAGRGLFATRDIPQGEIVSLYPAHMLGMEVDDRDVIRVFSCEQDHDYFEQHNRESKCGSNLFSLEYSGRDNSASLHLDVNPQQPIPPAWLSHIINDGAKIRSYRQEQDILDYYTETDRQRNCFHIPFGPSPLMATVATRHIKQGQECFVTYDLLYWVVELYEKEKQSDHQNAEGSMMITEAIGRQADRMDEALWESTKDIRQRYEELHQDVDNLFLHVEMQN